MAEEKKVPVHFKKVPNREGVYIYEPQKESQTLEEILHRISTPVIIKKSDDKE